MDDILRETLLEACELAREAHDAAIEVGTVWFEENSVERDEVFRDAIDKTNELCYCLIHDMKPKLEERS